jgi:superfamily II DNA or RNA helicase
VTLLSLLADRFFPRVRERGLQYVRSGRVRLELETPDLVVASVQGSRPYEVVLERQAASLRVCCSCPHAWSWRVACKHIWAVALTCEEQGLLAADGTPPRHLELTSRLPDGERAGTSHATALVPPWLADFWRLSRTLAPRSARFAAEAATVRYWLDLEQSLAGGSVTVGAVLMHTKPRALVLPPENLEHLPDLADRRILALLHAHDPSPDVVRPPWSLRGAMAGMLLPLLCATGRFHVRADCPDAPAALLRWDARPWQLALEVTRRGGQGYLLAGRLRRGCDEMPLAEADVLAHGAVVLAGAELSPLLPRHRNAWTEMLKGRPRVRVAASAMPALLEAVYASGSSALVDLPAEWRLERVVIVPRPRLRLTMGEPPCAHIHARLAFAYGDRIVEHPIPPGDILDPVNRRMMARDIEREQEARRRLIALRLRSCRRFPCGTLWRLSTRRLGAAVRALVQEKWTVEAEGKLYRAPTSWNTGVTSGVDWFGLHAGMECEGEAVPMPAILQALRRGESYVRLGDGSFGLLPEEWLNLLLPLADFGEEHGDHLRFRPSQAALLDALLSARTDTAFDDGFRAARERLRSFAVPGRMDPSAGFTGELRGYQKEGLGWMSLLATLGFGGCLADDMGLGKTVQVLALLQRRFDEGAVRKPTLIVVPRSLVFNWKREAARFTPNLPLSDQTDPGRAKDPTGLPQRACVLATYGTLRRDIAWLKDAAFDHVILDEAQAIKNARSQIARAARLLRADHRLALSGTPVENHAGELWSLFEFLNPGLLGSSRLLRRLAVKAPSAGQADLIARAVRPFILRRTKRQVARDLPERTEQTIPCVLGRAQRRLYEDLRDYYRDALGRLLAKGDKAGAGPIMLQALIRLRQAACHAGLLDASRRDEASAKLEVLLPRLLELTQEGHKALVFSQFTRFLDIVRRRLESRGMACAYLDGHTVDRAGLVSRFQTDPGLRVFLISLKAGGVGLNLTAADYVFLLDPWWNPAVEAQAIDRAHRMGQTRRVIACRLVARDTVEERLLELQQIKRDLADSIIRADAGLPGRLTREDLERLLS